MFIISFKESTNGYKERHFPVLHLNSGYVSFITSVMCVLVEVLVCRNPPGNWMIPTLITPSRRARTHAATVLWAHWVRYGAGSWTGQCSAVKTDTERDSNPLTLSCDTPGPAHSIKFFLVEEIRINKKMYFRLRLYDEVRQESLKT